MNLKRRAVKATAATRENISREAKRAGQSPLGHHQSVITSQLPIATWHEVIGEPTLGDAILDRIVHNAYRLEFDGPSMRKIKAAEATVPSTPATPAAAERKPSKAAKI